MAFGFSASSGAPSTNETELEEIEQENFLFSGLKRDSRVKLISPWPSDALPPPTSSLLSVASGRGLLAAAGPDALVLATTDSIRDTIMKDGANLKDFTPTLTIQVPRLSQVYFSADENFLVVCAESGGGLRGYSVDELLKNNTSSAFEISTGGSSVRALCPNPAPENAHVFAVLLSDGKLMLADLRTSSIVQGPNGPFLKDGVTCVSWSVKGKQLVAGTQDGTVFQLKPEPFGDVAAQIPTPPSLEPNHHVSTLYWLANDEFLIIYTPTNFDADSAPDSFYYHVQRQKGTQNFTFNKFIADPTGPFGLNRSPPHHFIQRLRDFKPGLDDVLLIASSASPDIGVFTRASQPLSQTTPVTNVYTTTTPPEGRKAALPTTMDEDKMMEAPDTSPIGLVLDLSCKQKLPEPIPGEEKDYAESPTPLPILMVLNNEGVLCAWWIIYKDSIKAGTGYPGLVAVQKDQPTTSTAPSTVAPASTPAAPASSSFGRPAFGSTSQPGAAGVAFGGPSALGGSSGFSRTGGAAFGQSGFGQPSALGGGMRSSAFGSPSSLGGTSSAFGAPASNNQQPSSTTPGQGFSAFSGKPSGFLGFANSGGFSALSQGNKSGQPAFGKTSPFGGTPASSFGGKTDQQSFGSTITMDSWTSPSATGTPAQQQTSMFGGGQQSSFTSTTQESEMGGVEDDRSRSEATPTPQVKPQDKPGGLFGSGTTPFKLGSTFKGDGTAKDDLPKPTGPSFLGDTFAQALESKNEPATPIKKEPGTEEQVNLKDISTTPASPPKPAAPSLFGTTPAQTQQASQPAKEPAPPKPAPEAAPLPPDFTLSSKKSPKTDDAPLPPDFITTAKKTPKAEAAPLPPDFITSKPKEKDDDLPPLAGSPPVAVEAPSDTSEAANRDDLPEVEEPDDEDFSESEEEEEEEEAGDEQTETPAKANEPTQTSKPSWSFTSVTDQTPPFAPSPPSSSKYTFPPASPPRQPRAPFSRVPSTTPAGLPKGPSFAPPTRQDRSPSPIRSFSQPIGRTFPGVSQPTSRPTSRLQQAPMTAEPEPTVEDLEDEEDAQMRAELAAPIVGKKKLDSFIARVGYGGEVSKQGIPGQIEKVYRDINSMVDTLGLNSRSLASFIKGHNELLPDNGRSRADLDEIAYDENFEDWCLAEIQDLQVIEKELEINLDAGRVSNVQEKITELATLNSLLSKLRSRMVAVKRQINLLTDKDITARRDAAPLTSEQSFQQRNVRTAFAELLKNLREAEDAVVLLRSKLASVRSNSANGSQPSPTFEAITNTILKMTSMIERKSADLTLLESKMQKLRTEPEEDDVIESIEATEEGLQNGTPKKLMPGAWRDNDRADSSPVATPSPKNDGRSESVLSESQGPGNFYTPRSRVGAEGNGSPLSKRSSRQLGLMSGKRAGTPATLRKEQMLREREEMLGVTDDVVKERMEKIVRRRAVAATLEGMLAKRGVKLET